MNEGGSAQNHAQSQETSFSGNRFLEKKDFED